MNTVLLTGSTGFVGSVLLAELKRLPEFRVVAAVRSAVSPASDDVVVVGNIDGKLLFCALCSKWCA